MSCLFHASLPLWLGLNFRLNRPIIRVYTSSHRAVLVRAPSFAVCLNSLIRDKLALCLCSVCVCVFEGGKISYLKFDIVSNSLSLNSAGPDIVVGNVNIHML